MDQKQIDRLNELAKKAKSPEGLTQWEADERAALRREYIDAVNILTPCWAVSRASWTTPILWTSRATSGS